MTCAKDRLWIGSIPLSGFLLDSWEFVVYDQAMSVVKGAEILHSDDREQWGEILTRRFAQLDLGVETFLRNEDAVTRADERFSAEDPFFAAVLDYHTNSNMTGVEAIADLRTKGLVTNVLSLNSSTQRDFLLRDLQRHGVSSKDVEIFDKDYELPVLLLYVGARHYYPEETADMRRMDLIERVMPDVRITEVGDVVSDDIFRLSDAAFDVLRDGVKREDKLWLRELCM